VTSEHLLDTRSRLLHVAAALMWERGYRSAGVDELCALADAKKGSFYHFFSSKTDLAIAAIEHSWSTSKRDIFEPIFSAPCGGLHQLDALVEKVAASVVSAEGGVVLGCPFGSLAQEMALHDTRISAALKTIFDEHCRFFEAALDRAVQQGEIPAGDNRTRAKVIFATLQGGLLLAKLENSPDPIWATLPAIQAIAAAKFD
jgi:TetR/AcrR family transcriptional repressor of nem operon